VLAVCVGPVTAAPLERRGVATVQPDRPRLGNLVRAVVEHLPARRSRRLTAHGHVLDIRSSAVSVDGTIVALPPAPMAVLELLATHPGRVVTRQEMLAALPGGGTDEHAVEMAVTRLRAALGDAHIVQTIVKRGYRLAYDPVPPPVRQTRRRAAT
jgi:uroporphyrinogen-III synthase